MQERRAYRFGGFGTEGPRRSPFNFGGILIGIVVLIMLFVVARFVFRLLYFIAPFLLIATAIMDYRTITGYGKWLLSLLRRNTLLGIGAIVLTVIGFPVVSVGLFGKALFTRRLRQAKRAYEAEQQRPAIGEYVEFEDIPSERSLRLPKIEKREEPPRPKKNNEYDQFFN